MIKLENMHKSYFDCFADCFSSVIHYHKQNYIYMFVKAWRVNFRLDSLQDPVTDLLSFCSSCRLVDQYCELVSDIRNFYDYNYMEDYIKENLARECPVIISADMYTLPWSEYYKKVHNAHFIIVYGYMGEHTFRIFDATRQRQDLEVDLRDIFRQSTCTIVTSPKKTEKKTDINRMLYVSRRTLSEDVEEGGYDRLMEVADFYFKEGNSPFTLQKENVEGEAFLQTLLHFARQRMAFAEFLKYAAATSDEAYYGRLGEELDALGAKWLSFRNKMIKYRLKGNYEEKREELEAVWRGLVKKDRSLYESYLYGRPEEDSSKDIKRKDRHLQPKVLDITGYFNANACNSDRWGNEAGFDRNGYFYRTKEDAFLYCKEADCKIRLYADRKEDHIRCAGQSIAIEQENVGAILVLGSCENGDFSEEMQLCYRDGTKETVSLSFTDWWEKDRFGEKEAGEMPCIHKKDNRLYEAGRVFIYSQQLVPEKGSGRLLKEIVLPDCSNMHIFGMVILALGKAG